MVKAIEMSTDEGASVDLDRVPKNVLYEITTKGKLKGDVVMLTAEKAYGLDFINFTRGETFTYPIHPSNSYPDKLIAKKFLGKITIKNS